MKKSKPTCRDFIVAAIQEVRPKTFGLKKGTASGVSLNKIFSIATSIYSAKEFVQALDMLLQEDIVILTERIYTLNVGGKDHVRLMKAPPEDRCGECSWYEDDDGKRVSSWDEVQKKGGRVHSDIRLYVKADGLPKIVAGLVTTPSKTEAVVQRILAKLGKKR